MKSLFFFQFPSPFWPNPQRVTCGSSKRLYFDGDWVTDFFDLFSLAWAELYLTLAMLVSRFDFEFVGTGPEDVEPDSDQFIIGTKSKHGVIVHATLC